MVWITQQDLVGWESSAERVYLHHHEHLLWPLRNCPALVGQDRRPLEFAPGTVEMVLELAPGPAQEPPWLTGRLLLVRDGEILAQADQFRFLNETHVLAGDRIYETSPVGENFARLPLFASSFPEAMLDRCLSLFFSHFTGVTVRYRDYTTTPGEPLHARPSILFQNVDEAGELHFDLIHTLPGFRAPGRSGAASQEFVCHPERWHPGGHQHRLPGQALPVVQET
jgi:hypothetical protein